MPNFRAPKSDIHFIARGLLVQGDSVILCKAKEEDWFFLPGGHVESGESARTTLLRELKEEIGKGDYNISSFLGVCENVFTLEGEQLQHEVNIVFKVDVPPNVTLNSLEEHIEFVSFKTETLNEHKILPEALKTGLLEWLEDGRPFLKEL
ncbi:MAG: NUDIX domain-containing protein [bacterium]|nr:NUDIX domain-containing protein [bacterium]MDZ4231606.1 NUDIX domain-containing protein [Patescibacteria group bacterium]